MQARKKEVLVVKEENNFQQEATAIKTRICLIYSTCPSGREPIEYLYKRGGPKRTNGRPGVSPGDAAGFCPADKTPANIRVRLRSQHIQDILNETLWSSFGPVCDGPVS